MITLHSSLSPRDESALMELDREEMKDFWTRAQWRDFLQNNSKKYFILLKYQEVLVGFALFEYSEGEWAHMLKILIASKHRGKGLGAKLLKKALSYLTHHLRSCTLEVRESSLEALGLYQKLGFKQVQRVKGFYRDGETAIKMLLSFEKL